jgi:hypothetical protein
MEIKVSLSYYYTRFKQKESFSFYHSINHPKIDWWNFERKNSLPSLNRVLWMDLELGAFEWTWWKSKNIE